MKFFTRETATKDDSSALIADGRLHGFLLVIHSSVRYGTLIACI